MNQVEESVDVLPDTRQRQEAQHVVVYRGEDGHLRLQEVGTFGDVKKFVATLIPGQAEIVYKYTRKHLPQVKQIVEF